MKSYLLDTHIALWWAAGSPRLSERAKALIKSKDNPIFLSVVSVWEASIKSALGKMQLPGKPAPFFQALAQRSNFTILPVHLSHAAGVHSLPPVHRDPFDRLLISQAIAEDLIVISDDQVFERYSLPGLIF